MNLARKQLISNINLQNSGQVNNASDLNSNPRVSNFRASIADTSNKTDNITPQKGFSHLHNEWKSPTASRNASWKPYEKTKQIQQFYGKSITGTCYLISEERFAVELSNFSTPAIDVFKTVPSRSYNTKTRIWDFHIKDYDTLQQKMALLQPEVVIGRLPPYVIHCCQMQKPDYSNIDLNRIDSELRNTLMPFQEEGVCFGIDKNGRCLIADDMGLGKTFQALAIADYYRENWPLLIITTLTMKNAWQETIQKYLPSVSVMHIQYMVTSKDYIGDSKILIVSYDMMSRSLDKLLERNFGVMIIDESHTLKNFKAKCTKAATDLSKKAKRVILLSGTPALSRPSELYCQLAMIDEKFFGNFFEYSRRYCDGKSTQFGWDASGKSNLQELEIVLTKKFMIRRTKDDVLKALPEKSRQVVTLDVHLDQLSKTDKDCLNALALNYNRLKKSCEKQAALLNFFAETSKIKIPSVCSFILQTLEENQKFIVFAHHQKMLDAIEKVLNKKKKKFIRIDGNTTSEQRKYFVDKFQLNDEYVCAILSITAANAGITLTAARLVIFAELHWNPSILSQAESRAHRIGQEGQVIVKYLIASGTADDSIWPMLENKRQTLREVGLFKDSFQDVSITKQDVGEKVNLAEGLNFAYVTNANTIDISSYFKPLEKDKSLKEDKDGTNEKSNDDKSRNENDTSANISSAEVEFFNDDFDDMLGNIDIDV